MTFSWTQPQCLHCYEVWNPGRIPVRLKEAEIEKCVTCGNETNSGIYIQIDPKTAPFPTNRK